MGFVWWEGLGISGEGLRKDVAMEISLICINVGDFWFLSTWVVGSLTEKQSGRNQRSKREAWLPESNNNYHGTTKIMHENLQGNRRLSFFFFLGGSG